MLHVIDLENCNLGSVLRAFDRIGISTTPVREPAQLADAKAIVLPGVGAFAASMGKLDERGFSPVLRDLVQRDGVPLLGICLGMQLLGDASEEHGIHAGLGLVPGTVKRLRPVSRADKVPHVGWADAVPAKESYLFPEQTVSSFYFDHSYHFDCDDSPDIAARTRFGDEEITVAIQRGHVAGVQFHPEKSQDAGLDLLSAHLHWLRGKGRL
ncbi:MAG: imidazole glycerol phosphate synthase subunit HisH [Nisaea sp.]|jgi:glutamine amidotransferase|uniref:imidazole glycerol phosphate synthase subunit HisH n=1 Tax=Nisaea sp. TaxID=2024842 RepID=UPI001B04C914|nr:imidazole glycerol phosphate synthase subunit HisH [Nisaea sp.]MBO6562889.1 imidazole glycerol phosphate synthase subunit HisH [Nisaea sp.]